MKKILKIICFILILICINVLFDLQSSNPLHEELQEIENPIDEELELSWETYSEKDFRKKQKGYYISRIKIGRRYVRTQIILSGSICVLLAIVMLI